VRPEVGGFGTVPINVGHEGDIGWQATFRLPPGLPAGWHEVRIRIGEGPSSDAVRIAVDVPLPDREMTVTGVADGTTWSPNVLTLGTGSLLSLWVDGLPDNADRANLAVILGEERLDVTYVEPANAGEEPRQVNAEVPTDTPLGPTRVRVVLGDRESSGVDVDVRA
jgi:hypothetical protein